MSKWYKGCWQQPSLPTAAFRQAPAVSGLCHCKHGFQDDPFFIWSSHSCGMWTFFHDMHASHGFNFLAVSSIIYHYKLLYRCLISFIWYLTKFSNLPFPPRPKYCRRLAIMMTFIPDGLSVWHNHVWFIKIIPLSFHLNFLAPFSSKRRHYWMINCIKLSSIFLLKMIFNNEKYLFSAGQYGSTVWAVCVKALTSSPCI